MLRFSVSGGVYFAIDQETGNTVVIKEARPATAFDAENHDAVDRLRKEYRLLQKLQDTGITPLPIDLFQDWEHLFLVEEYVPGPDLAIYVVSSNPLFSPYPVEQQQKKVYVDKLRILWTKLAQGIALIHSRGIVYGDLSIKNVIVSNENAGEVRIIDLEAAWEEGVDTNAIGNSWLHKPKS